jgi:hypothetical protein
LVKPEVKVVIVAGSLFGVVFQGTLPHPGVIIETVYVFVVIVAEKNIVAWAVDRRLEGPVNAINLIQHDGAARLLQVAFLAGKTPILTLRTLWHIAYS